MSPVLVVRTMEHLGYNDKWFHECYDEVPSYCTLDCNTAGANLDDR